MKAQRERPDDSDSVVDSEDSVYRISDVPEGLSHDMDGRARRYVISMSIRTICVILAVVVPSPWRWIFAVGAVFLPYVAVVVANAGRLPVREDASYEDNLGRPTLPEMPSSHDRTGPTATETAWADGQGDGGDPFAPKPSDAHDASGSRPGGGASRMAGPHGNTTDRRDASPEPIILEGSIVADQRDGRRRTQGDETAA